MSATVTNSLRYIETARGCEIDLSDNTNLWGAPPSVRSALESLNPVQLTRYPTAYSNELKRYIAKYAGVEGSMIATGCGSDDVLDSAIRAFGIPGDLLVMQDPGFSMIPVFATVSGLSVRGIGREWDLTSEIRSSNARITYLCSPNNPTGEVLSVETIEAVLSNASGLVIVDEAYIEFGGTSSTQLLGRFDNLLITRTFSKALGLAGFRLGYGIASPSIVSRIEAARGPYKVSAIAEAAGSAVLESDLQWVADNAREAVVMRKWLDRELRRLGFEPFESGANFLLVPVTCAKGIVAKLRDRSIAVRAFEGLRGTGDALRITVAPLALMQRFIDVLSEIMR